MNKQTILAFILIGIIVIFWGDYYRWLNPPKPGADSTLVDSAARIPTREPVEMRERDLFLREERSPEPPEIETDLARGRTSDTIDTDISFQFADTLAERIVSVNTRNYRLKLSSHGAGLVSYSLKPSRHYLKQDIPLLNEEVERHFGCRFWTVDGPFETGDFQYRIDDGRQRGDVKITLGEGEERKIRFLAESGEGMQLEVSYTFRGSTYDFSCEVITRGFDREIQRDHAEFYWQGGLAYTEPDTGQDEHFSKAYIGFTGDVLEKMKIEKKKDEYEGPITGDALWGAVRTKYFTASVIPQGRYAQGAWLESKVAPIFGTKYHPNRLGFGLYIPLDSGSPAAPVQVYIGPLDDSIIEVVEPNLKRVMTWGAGIPGVDTIVKPISHFILWALKALRSIMPNYGICIILFSILVKLVIWPLTRKSYQSMSAMQGLQPKLQALREKYKNDPQRMQKETMALYKEEKVNPMGGCFPMLLQMPLLYGLFVVFRATIEFRRSSFLWIEDLSLPDVIFSLPFSLPFYGDHVALLPIVMGITTYFQSKMTMTDPKQKPMLVMMPVILTLVFNQFPSGLTLYYTLFNVWTVVQQKVTPPPHVKKDAEEQKPAMKVRERKPKRRV